MDPYPELLGRTIGRWATDFDFVAHLLFITSDNIKNNNNNKQICIAP